MIRRIDFLLAALGLLIGGPILILIYILGLFDTGSPIFTQERVGKNQEPFVLIKFRTMRVGTASVASHLANISAITPLGLFLRRSKLDELPQLWNVLRGDMSLVGPRPCLYNQSELIEERERLGVFKFRPGITGLAQVNNVDMSEPKLLATMDSLMLQQLSVKSYLKYIAMTIMGKGSGDKVRVK